MQTAQTFSMAGVSGQKRGDNCNGMTAMTGQGDDSMIPAQNPMEPSVAKPYPRLLWPGLLAAGPLATVFVYVAHAQAWPVLGKPALETYAISVLPLALAAFLLKAWRTHRRLYLFMAAFALIALLREWHFAWTGKGVYLMLLALILAAAWQHRVLMSEARDGPFLPWFKGTLVVYFLGVLVARRVFRDILPDEQPIHVALEETLENVAHSMLLLTALAGSWKRRPESAAPTSLPQTRES